MKPKCLVSVVGQKNAPSSVHSIVFFPGLQGFKTFFIAFNFFLIPLYLYWNHSVHLSICTGLDVAQLVRASDHHTADAGLIPWCGKGFSFQSQL